MPRLLVCSSREEVFEDCCSKPYQFIQPDCVRACLIELFQSNYPDAINGMVSESYFGLRSRTNQDFLQDVQVLIDILYESYLGRASSAELGEDVASNDSEWARLSLRCISNTFRSRYSVNISDALIKAGLSDKNVISNTSPFFGLEPCGPIALPPISIDPPGVQQPECGTIEYELIGPEVDNGEWMINLVLSGQVDYPLGEVQYIIDGGPPTYGPMLNVGDNILGSFLLGQTVQIVIVNAANDECNIALPEIVTECPVIDVITEIFQDCDEGVWGVGVVVSWTEHFPPGAVMYTTPLTPSPVPGTPIGVGQYACGPLSIADDPGPMTIVVQSGANKECVILLGPFESSCEEPPAFLCAGPETGEFSVRIGGTGSIAVSSTSSYHSTRTADGTVTVGKVMFDQGQYCLFPSTDIGGISGTIKELIYSGDVNSYDPRRYAALDRLTVQNCSIQGTLPWTGGNAALTYYYMDNLPNVTAVSPIDLNTNLKTLVFRNMPVLPSLPSVDDNVDLEYFTVVNIPLITTLPSMTNSVNLLQYWVQQAGLISTIPSLSTCVLLDKVLVGSLPLVTSLPSLSSNVLLTHLEVLNMPGLLSLPDLSSNPLLSTLRIQFAGNLLALPSLAANAGLTQFFVRSTAMSILPDFHPSANVSLTLNNNSGLGSSGVLPEIINLSIISNHNFTTTVEVDKLFNALRPASGGVPGQGVLNIPNAIKMLRSSASDANFNACVSAGWTGMT